MWRNTWKKTHHSSPWWIRTVYFYNISYICVVSLKPTALCWEALVRLKLKTHWHKQSVHPTNIHCNFTLINQRPRVRPLYIISLSLNDDCSWQIFIKQSFFFLKKMFLRKLNYLGPKYAHAICIYLLRKLAGAIRIGSSVSAPGAKLIPLLKPCGKQDHASVPVELTLAWLKLIYLFTSSRFAHTLRCQIL